MLYKMSYKGSFVTKIFTMRSFYIHDLFVCVIPLGFPPRRHVALPPSTLPLHPPPAARLRLYCHVLPPSHDTFPRSRCCTPAHGFAFSSALRLHSMCTAENLAHPRQRTPNTPRLPYTSRRCRSYHPTPLKPPLKEEAEGREREEVADAEDDNGELVVAKLGEQTGKGKVVF
ncbi:hypothetical protein GUJ93_ZPchr0001g29655 [Zizania palustris]|uniref:Uncharacterized protein n=1 Tax=Zizania palustris TaxID=103762 RepID=A0A8J5VD27_ZIZPA|nr:hypothetical protein GUJ93_ZPchr0001g29655 [Zizania palustris]